MRQPHENDKTPLYASLFLLKIQKKPQPFFVLYIFFEKIKEVSNLKVKILYFEGLINIYTVV
jgi:hypothetical protein